MVFKRAKKISTEEIYADGDASNQVFIHSNEAHIPHPPWVNRKKKISPSLPPCSPGTERKK